jgi:4-amino-4-deoxy-L-arabinose transferase-like glycosyltransferase
MRLALLKYRLALPIFVFLLLLAHGASLGLTDDEAYYWVLAQKPRWGFAYHPPMIVWMISLSEFVFGWITSRPHQVLVRLPAAFCAAGSLAFGMAWIDAAGAQSSRLWKGGVATLSFAGFFALSWMSVPDLPLFFGWTMAFYAVWKLCFGPLQTRNKIAYPLLACGIAIAVLSKFSGVLAAASAILALLLWAPRPARIRGTLAIALGLVLAGIPILIWNLQHDWFSILYQAKGRHEGAGISLVRWLRFWLVQIAVAGPWLVAFTVLLFLRAERPMRYVAVWIFPGLIFCVQPLFSDFKPHWAFVVWWPAALAMGWAYASAHDLKIRLMARWQSRYGIVLSILILIACHAPLQSWVMSKLSSELPNPKYDVTNDMYGWDKLPALLSQALGERTLPVTGSRYQSTSQAAFTLGGVSRVSMVPKERPIRDEWVSLAELDPQDGVGPEWPRLRSAVIYVADNRYDLIPAFRDADCKSLGRAETDRAGFAARWIEAWICEPH